MTEARIQLSNGVLFDLLEPDQELIEIEAIAHSLSQLCRFTGHTAEFYSVAQHCVVVSRLVEPEYALAGLLHDATEAFIGDLSTPLKALLPEYRRIEEELQWAIMERFFVQTEFNHSVKHADRVAMATERRDLGITGNDEYWEGWGLPEPAPWAIVPLKPSLAKVAFLARFAEIVLRPGEGQAPVIEEAEWGPALPMDTPDRAQAAGRTKLDPNRFDTNEDVSRRLSEAETEEPDGTDWTVVG